MADFWGTWGGLTPAQRLAAIGHLEADNGQNMLRDAQNVMHATNNRAQMLGWDTDKVINFKAPNATYGWYQPLWEEAARNRLPGILNRPDFQSSVDYATKVLAGQVPDTTNGATHFVARNIEQLAQAEPNKYRSFRQWATPEALRQVEDASHNFYRVEDGQRRPPPSQPQAPAQMNPWQTTALVPQQQTPAPMQAPMQPPAPIVPSPPGTPDNIFDRLGAMMSSPLFMTGASLMNAGWNGEGIGAGLLNGQKAAREAALSQLQIQQANRTMQQQQQRDQAWASMFKGGIIPEWAKGLPPGVLPMVLAAGQDEGLKILSQLYGKKLDNDQQFALFNAQEQLKNKLHMDVLKYQQDLQNEAKRQQMQMVQDTLNGKQTQPITLPDPSTQPVQPPVSPRVPSQAPQIPAPQQWPSAPQIERQLQQAQQPEQPPVNSQMIETAADMSAPIPKTSAPPAPIWNGVQPTSPVEQMQQRSPQLATPQPQTPHAPVVPPSTQNFAPGYDRSKLAALATILPKESIEILANPSFQEKERIKEQTQHEGKRLDRVMTDAEAAKEFLAKVGAVEEIAKKYAGQNNSSFLPPGFGDNRIMGPVQGSHLYQSYRGVVPWGDKEALKDQQTLNSVIHDLSLTLAKMLLPPGGQNRETDALRKQAENIAGSLSLYDPQTLLDILGRHKQDALARVHKAAVAQDPRYGLNAVEHPNFRPPLSTDKIPSDKWTGERLDPGTKTDNLKALEGHRVKDENGVEGYIINGKFQPVN